MEDYLKGGKLLLAYNEQEQLFEEIVCEVLKDVDNFNTKEIIKPSYVAQSATGYMLGVFDGQIQQESISTSKKIISTFNGSIEVDNDKCTSNNLTLKYK